MTITLDKNNYRSCRHTLDEICHGEMCKILSMRDVLTGYVSYHFDTDVTRGWSFLSDHSFHGHDDNVTWTRTGLGVFVLIRLIETDDGGCVLEFTDDLNPDLP